MRLLLSTSPLYCSKYVDGEVESDKKVETKGQCSAILFYRPIRRYNLAVSLHSDLLTRVDFFAIVQCCMNRERFC